MATDFVTVRATVDQDTHRALRRYARATGRSMADTAGALLDAAASDHDLDDDRGGA
jgi:plasmid stability protein